MLRRRGRLLLLLISGAVLLAGCASAEPEGSGSGSGSGSVTAPSATSVGPMMVTRVEQADATHVRITVQVPAPKATCVRHLAGRVTADEAGTVFVQVTFQSPAPEVQRCAGVSSASTVVRVPSLTNKKLVVDYEKPWVPVRGSTTYRQCTGPFGCDDPPRNHCDPAWLDLAGNTGELPTERYYKNLGCTQRWLVMNISATVTGCQGTDGGTRPAGCKGIDTRWFFQFRSKLGWVVVASGRAAGCASVHATIPAFPTTLCERLPAVG